MTGASLMSVMLIVTFAITCSDVESPVKPGSAPVFPLSLAVIVKTVEADGGGSID